MNKTEPIQDKVGKALLLIISMTILVDVSFFTINKIAGYIRILMDISGVLLLYIYCQSNGLLKKDLKKLLFVEFYIVLNGLVSGNTTQTIIISIFILLAFVFTNIIDLETLLYSFRKLMIFLAAFSLVSLIVYKLYPSIIYYLPSIQRAGGSVYYNAFFSIISNSTYVTRNFGVFWEPGAFSIFLNIALLLELFFVKTNTKCVLLYAITILSTLSTLGIICMAVLFLALFLDGNKANKATKIIVSILVIGVLAWLAVDGERFIFHVFGKFKPIHTGEMNQTTAVRADAIYYPFKAFLSSPLFGIGFNNFLILQEAECSNMATCTFINWLCIYGVFGLAFIYGVIRFFITFGHKLTSKICMAAFSLMLFSTENYVQILFIYILVFYGYKVIDYEKKHSNISY